MVLQDDKPQTFSGADIMVIFSIPGTQLAYLKNKNYRVSTEVQTITISSTSSLLPVRRCGEAKPKTYTTGGRTFAGTIVFTVLGADPFKDVFATDALNSSSVNDGSWHIDQMPPFDVLIVAQNELGGIAVQIISNARICNWGTTYSVDDLYTESTYTYVAEDVTPLLVSQDSLLEDIPQVGMVYPKTPDDEYNNGGIRTHTAIFGQLSRAVNNFQPNTFLFSPKNTTQYTDPGIPSELQEILDRYSNTSNNSLELH